MKYPRPIAAAYLSSAPAIGDDGKGKIRMPRAMLQRLHGGEGGWFDLKDVSLTDAAIAPSMIEVVRYSPSALPNS